MWLYLVLEVLSSNERVEKFFPSFNHGMDLATSTAKIRVIIECFPSV